MHSFSGLLFTPEHCGGPEGRDEDEKQTAGETTCEISGTRKLWTTHTGCVIPEEVVHIYRKQNRNGKLIFIIFIIKGLVVTNITTSLSTLMS